MPSANVTWQMSPSSMADKVASYAKRLLEAVYALAVEWASRIQSSMKSGARWTDRTGAARAGLFGRAMKLAVGAVIVCGGTVFYQIYLERKNAGRYAIILPTMQANYAPIFASLQQLVR